MVKHSEELIGPSSSCAPFSPPRENQDSARTSLNPTRPCPPDGALHVAAPELFAELIRHYSAALDEAVEQRIHASDSLATELSDLTTRLGRLQAGARDVIQLHARALDVKLASVPQQLIGVYVEEGRFLVLELMGRLLSYYRTALHQIARPPAGQENSSLAPWEAHRGNEE
jgi:hypothetical protein